MLSGQNGNDVVHGGIGLDGSAASGGIAGGNRTDTYSFDEADRNPGVTATIRGANRGPLLKQRLPRPPPWNQSPSVLIRKFGGVPSGGGCRVGNVDGGG